MVYNTGTFCENLDSTIEQMVTERKDSKHFGAVPQRKQWKQLSILTL